MPLDAVGGTTCVCIGVTGIADVADPVPSAHEITAPAGGAASNVKVTPTSDPPGRETVGATHCPTSLGVSDNTCPTPLDVCTSSVVPAVLDTTTGGLAR